MKDHNQDIATFVAFCIEQYSKAKQISTNSVVNLFRKFAVADYLAELFDVLHTQGHNWIIADIDEFIDKRRTE